MFNKEQLRYLLDSSENINFENFYKSDLITMIQILREKLKTEKEKIDKGLKKIEQIRQYFDDDLQPDFIILENILNGGNE